MSEACFTEGNIHATVGYKHILNKKQDKIISYCPLKPFLTDLLITLTINDVQIDPILLLPWLLILRIPFETLVKKPVQ